MKRFNLEEFKKNPSRNVVTRDGKPVRIICTDAKRDYPIVALIKDNDEESVFLYRPDGMWCKENISDMDLFFDTVTKHGFANLYRTQSGMIIFGDFCIKEEEAIKEINKDLGEHITTIKVEWEE